MSNQVSNQMIELKTAELQYDELKREFSNMMDSLCSLDYIRNNAINPADYRDCNLQYHVLFAQKDDLENRLSLAEGLVNEIRKEIREGTRKEIRAPIKPRDLSAELKTAEIQRDELKMEFSNIMKSLCSLNYIRKEMIGTADEHNCNLQYYTLFAQKDDLGSRLTLAERLVYEIQGEIRGKNRGKNLK